MAPPLAKGVPMPVQSFTVFPDGSLPAWSRNATIIFSAGLPSPVAARANAPSMVSPKSA